MLLLHMQEIVFVDSQEGLLSSRGGGGQTYWHQAYTSMLPSPIDQMKVCHKTRWEADIGIGRAMMPSYLGMHHQ